MTSDSENTEAKKILENFGLTIRNSKWGIRYIGNLLSSDRGISVGVMYPGKHDPDGVNLLRVADLIGDRINRQPEFKVTAAVNQEYKRTILEGGELLISLVGDVGRVAVVEDWAKGWNPARAIAVLRFKEPRDAYFVRLVLKSENLKKIMVSWSNTTVQTTLNLKEIKEIPIPWPTEEERKQICSLLSAFDDKIELNRQMNRTLEAMARALFKSWFVDFDPVRAKMRGEQPEGMDAATAALFPDELVEVDGREVPKGWRWENLSTVADLNWGNTSITKKSYVNEGYDAYSASGLDGKLPTFENECLGIVVSAIGANSGATWLARGKWTSIKNTLRFWPIVDEIAAEYLFLATNRKETWPLRGSAQPFIAQEDARRIQVLVPFREISQAFKSFIQPIYETIWQNDQECAQLAQLRDVLLPRLLSGEIEVSEWAAEATS